MNILVTGASGFVGRHLLNYLRMKQTERCIGLARTTIHDQDSILCDLSDRVQVDTVLRELQPAFIYHMAGSFSNNYETDVNNNIISAKNLLDALVNLKIPARILLMGSAAEYGEVAADKNPITEEQALRPISIYGWTKSAQSQLASVYANMYGIEVMVARTFNLLGDGASENLFIGRINKQIDDVLQGRASRISVGSVDAIRDYLDINKACEMYRVIATRGKPGEIYNVGSGKPVTMRDLLKTMLGKAGLDYSIVDEMTHTKNTKIREVSVSYANIDKFTKLANT